MIRLTVLTASLVITLPLAAQDTATARLGPQARDTVRLTLTEALGLAEPASEQVGIAEASVRRAKGAVMETRATLLPQLTLTPQYNRVIKTPYSSFFQDTSSTSSNPFTARNQWRIGGNAAWTPLNLSQFSRVGASKAGSRSAEIQLSQQQATTILNVASAYYDAALTDQLVTITEFTLAQAERTYKDVTLGREVGTQSEFEQLRSRVARDNQIPVVTRARANRDIAFTRLKQLLDLPHASAIVLTTPLDATSAPTELPGNIDTLVTGADTSAGNRSVVRVADEAVRQNEDLHRAAARQWIPTLGAQMNYNQAGFGTQFWPNSNQFYTDWSVAAGLNWPFFTSGRILGQKRQAEANLDAARLQAKLTREQAALDNETLIARLREAEDNAAATAAVVEQAARAYEIAELRFREGLSTQTELQDVRLQLEQARANQAQAARDLRVARLRITLLPYLPLGTADFTTLTTSQATSVGAAAAQVSGQVTSTR